MENLFIDNGRRVQPGYESVATDLVGQLKQIRDRYKDTTGEPVRRGPSAIDPDVGSARQIRPFLSRVSRCASGSTNS